MQHAHTRAAEPRSHTGTTWCPTRATGAAAGRSAVRPKEHRNDGRTRAPPSLSPTHSLDAPTRRPTGPRRSRMRSPLPQWESPSPAPRPFGSIRWGAVRPSSGSGHSSSPSAAFRLRSRGQRAAFSSLAQDHGVRVSTSADVRRETPLATNLVPKAPRPAGRFGRVHPRRRPSRWRRECVGRARRRQRSAGGGSMPPRLSR